MGGYLLAYDGCHISFQGRITPMLLQKTHKEVDREMGPWKIRDPRFIEEVRM